ncbi:hypothetical protein HLRTI_000493 [Halorhabdus tiamatea SARL4B]|uniref:Uncharacterized protein n=1 Tax=Halorhabdus tiamatea SARL4B TaxID=1033806 RepID=F7PMP3_9EURY|nr:hypothetical protein HLRTI_000493 [Halorhabdus tiamatea SARL4B]
MGLLGDLLDLCLFLMIGLPIGGSMMLLGVIMYPIDRGGMYKAGEDMFDSFL